MEMGKEGVVIDGGVWLYADLKYLDQRAIAAMKNIDTYVLGYMRDSVMRWIEHGILPGSFLEAVIRNNLKEAFVRADVNNAKHVRELVCWFWNYAPVTSWGHSEAIEAWQSITGKGVTDDKN